MSKWYNPSDMDSYGKTLNFIIGGRGIGKTYSMKRRCIKRFLRSGKQFIYVRRYKSELKKIRQFFDDIALEFPKLKLIVKGGKDGARFYINDKLAGWAVPLSGYSTEKSTPYPNVDTIIFDEFLVEKGMTRYLPDEVGCFLNFMHTIDRKRGVTRAFLLANAVTIVNPYFLYWEIQPNIEKRYNTFPNRRNTRHIMVEIPNDSEFYNDEELTPFEELITDTKYGDYAIKNTFVNDNDTFIIKRSKAAKFMFAIYYKERTLGIWVDYGRGYMYTSYEFDPNTRYIYSLSTVDHRPNMLLMANWKSDHYLKQLVKAFKFGYLCFDNQVIKNTMYEVFKIMSI